MAFLEIETTMNSFVKEKWPYFVVIDENGFLLELFVTEDQGGNQGREEAEFVGVVGDLDLMETRDKIAEFETKSGWISFCSKENNVI